MGCGVCFCAVPGVFFGRNLFLEFKRNNLFLRVQKPAGEEYVQITFFMDFFMVWI